MKAVMMRAVGGPEVLEYVEVAKPAAGPGQVLIRAMAIGVGMVDVLIRTGAYKWMPPLPTSPGSDLAGVIEAAGDGVTGWSPGDRVLLTARDLPVRGGCYTEYIAVPAQVVYRLPANVDFAQAAALSNYQVANALLTDAARGAVVKSVFISGIAGGVGSALADLAKSMGFAVIGTASGPEKIAFARGVGADHVINYRTENVRAEVLRWSSGRGVDLVLDHVGGAQFCDNLKLLARYGLLVSYNAFGAPPESDLLSELRKDGGWGAAVRCFSFHMYDSDPARRRELMSAVIAELAAGRINPRIAVRLPLAAAADAHRMIQGGGGLGKIILIP